MTALELRAELYDQDAVAQAIRAFESIATISASHGSVYHVCTFECCAYDEAQTMDEFENYLIDYMNSRSL